MRRNSYRAAAAVSVTPAGSFIIAELHAAIAGVVLYVRRIRFSMGGTVSAAQAVLIRKNSAPATAGTPAAVVAVPNDSNDPAAAPGAVVRVFTVVPTTGAIIGDVDAYVTSSHLNGTAPVDTPFAGPGETGRHLILRDDETTTILAQTAGANIFHIMYDWEAVLL